MRTWNNLKNSLKSITPEEQKEIEALARKHNQEELTLEEGLKQFKKECSK